MVNDLVKVAAEARIKELMEERVALRTQHNELSLHLEEVIGELVRLLQLLGIRKITNELGLWVYNPPGTSVSLDKDELKLFLLGEGLTADRIQAAFKQAMRETPKKASLTFRPVTEG